MNLINWATIASPIVGTIAIIVSLVISGKASRDAKKQIKAIYDLLEVFVAAQNPNMVQTMHQYEEQLRQLDVQISLAKEDLDTNHYPFGGRGAKIDDIEAIEEMKERKRKYEKLLLKRDELIRNTQLIQAYLDKVSSNPKSM